MFLRELSEDEQKVFLNLAYTLMNVNGEITKEEETTFSKYQEEVRVDVSLAQNVDFSAEVLKLKQLDPSKKKKIFFELLAMAMIDHEYDEAERGFMKIMQRELQISDDVGAKMEIVVHNIVNVYTELYRIVSQ